METIFDYNPTELELRRFGIKREDGDYEKQLKWMKEMLAGFQSPEYYYLGLLFSMRGDDKRAAEYFAKATPGQRAILIQDF
jgi:hypothetical protein